MSRLIFIFFVYVFSFTSEAKQIAITFDDAPRPATHLGAKERTQLLIKNLKNVKAPKAMFFATGKHLTNDNKSNLLAYAQAGHFIAHHSQNHLWYYKTNNEEYQQDFLTAHELLKDFPNYRKLYRYPFLDEGRSQAKIAAMSEFLKQHDYQEGYVTIDNYDWYLDHLYQKAKQNGQTIDEEALKRLYVKTLIDAAEFYHEIAIKHLDRSPKHVLLLHDNDLAALFIGELISALRQQGWEIISPIEAYNDSIADEIPNTLFRGQGRVAALAHDKGVPAKQLIHPAEDEKYLSQKFETLVLPNANQKIPLLPMQTK